MSVQQDGAERASHDDDDNVGAAAGRVRRRVPDRRLPSVLATVVREHFFTPVEPQGHHRAQIWADTVLGTP
jgi:hypothetical protein